MQDNIQGDRRSDDLFSRKGSSSVPWTLIVLIGLISAALFVGVLLFKHDLQATLSGLYRATPLANETSTATKGRSLNDSRPAISPPVVTKPSGAVRDGECPPGQVAGILESERTGRLVICHEPSFARSPPPKVVANSRSVPVPARTEQVRRDMPHRQAQQRPTVPTKAQQCADLEREVKRLDSMARQPQSGPTQDWIRAERQKARDQQFRLRCR